MSPATLKGSLCQGCLFGSYIAAMAVHTGGVWYRCVACSSFVLDVLLCLGSQWFLWRCWTQDFDITLACFPFGTTAYSLLLKLLQSNGQDCKYTERRPFCFYPAQEKINPFLSFDLTNQSSPGKHPFSCNSISLCFIHYITVFKKLLCLPRRAVSGLIL